MNNQFVATGQPSGHSGMNIDNNREPGPLTKLLLQGRGKTSPSSMTEETKTPEKDLNEYLPLLKAALKGDWEFAKRFFEQDPDAVTAKITRKSETVLHIAVGTGRAIHFVEKLLELIPTEALLTLRDQAGQTALHYAAVFGNVEAAKLLVAKNPDLTNTWDYSPLLSLHVAAGYAHKEMVSYLLPITRDDVVPNPFADESGVKLLNLVITAECYDAALYLVQLYPRLGTLVSSAGNTALGIIAGNPSAFPSGSRLNIWQRFIYYCIPVKFENFSSRPKASDMENPDSSHMCVQICSLIQSFRVHNSPVCQKLHVLLWEVIETLVPQVRHIRETKLMHQQTLQLVKCLCTEVTMLDYSTAASIFRPPVLSGARFGINEIVEEIMESFPSATWSLGIKRQNIFLLAVRYRRENIFNLLYQMSEHKQVATHLIDTEKNNMLHLAGKLAPSYRLNLVSGAALQMQRELQWYKEVEKFMRPDYKDEKNSNLRTPAEEFSEGHKDLVKEGEKWMKDTANSCTVAAALIATIAFAASITVPGGNNSDNGFPIFYKENAFIIFAVSDALSLFSSSASLLMFLSILTARYAEADFLYALPKRLIIGLVTLFLSITFMMTAFGATLYLVFGHKKDLTLIPVAALACVPVTLFVSLQFPLLVDMVRSTYFPDIFGKRSERVLY